MKSDTPYPERQTYYAQGQSWATEVQDSLRSSRRRAYIAAGAAAAVAMLEAVAIVVMMPLKTVVPYTITVDRQTGYIETAQALRPGALSQNLAVTQAFLAQYVMARETFDVTDLQNNYRQISAWTGGAARDQYISFMQKSNPRSPENINDASTVLKTTVKSISLLSKTSALVRFDVEHVAGDSAPVQRQPYTAVIGFHYTGGPMRAEDRFLNPLGFQVTAYRRDAEAAGPVADAQVAP